MLNNQTHNPPSPLSLRPREAAKALGMSERTLWQLTHDGKIPSVRLGSGKRQIVLYPVAVLTDWLAKQASISRAASPQHVEQNTTHREGSLA